MAVYEWRGINTAGKTVKGTRDADSDKALKAMLRREGVRVTEVLAEAAAKKKNAREVDLAKYFRRVSASDLALTTRQLATLLHSGIPLVAALTAIIEQLEHPELKTAFTQTRDRVNEGSSLGDALKAHPKIFSTLFVNMVAAGEASGTLEVVLSRLAEFLDSQSKLQSKVFSALAYPVFMFFVGVGVITILMIVVVPKITDIYKDFDQALPWYTQTLIVISTIMANYWWLVLAGIIGGIYGFRRWHASPKGRERWDLFVLRVPLIGKLVTMLAVSRFARTLATLLASGVPVLRAMEITRNVLGNTELMRVVEEARTSVREGESIATPLKRSGRFPPIVTHMIAIGEKSGQLETMLENVATAYDQQVETRVIAMTSLLEPMMIVFMGGGAGFIAFSIMMPLLQISDFAGNQ